MVPVAFVTAAALRTCPQSCLWAPGPFEAAPLALAMLPARTLSGLRLPLGLVAGLPAGVQMGLLRCAAALLCWLLC